MAVHYSVCGIGRRIYQDRLDEEGLCWLLVMHHRDRPFVSVEAAATKMDWCISCLFLRNACSAELNVRSIDEKWCVKHNDFQ